MRMQRPNAQLFAGISPKRARKMGKYKGSWYSSKTRDYRDNPGPLDMIKRHKHDEAVLQEAIDFAEKSPEIAIARKCVRRARRFMGDLKRLAKRAPRFEVINNP